MATLLAQIHPTALTQTRCILEMFTGVHVVVESPRLPQRRRRPNPGILLIRPETSKCALTHETWRSRESDPAPASHPAHYAQPRSRLLRSDMATRFRGLPVAQGWPDQLLCCCTWFAPERLSPSARERVPFPLNGLPGECRL